MMAIDVKRLNESETIDLTRCYAESDRQMQVSRRQQALLAAAGADGPKQWAIIKVAPRRENDVDKSLSVALVEHWLPLRKGEKNEGGRRTGAVGAQVWELAWPGYMFVRVVNTPASWAGLATVKHVRAVLGCSESPMFISDNKILRIKAELATLKDASKNSGVLIGEGQKVRVEEGPFASFPATVTKVGEGSHEGRAWVEVMVFGRAVPIELDLAQLAKS